MELDSGAVNDDNVFLMAAFIYMHENVCNFVINYTSHYFVTLTYRFTIQNICI